MIGVTTGSESVGSGIVDNIDFGHGEAGGDGEVFHDVIKARAMMKTQATIHQSFRK